MTGEQFSAQLLVHGQQISVYPYNNYYNPATTYWNSYYSAARQDNSYYSARQPAQPVQYVQTQYYYYPQQPPQYTFTQTYVPETSSRTITTELKITRPTVPHRVQTPAAQPEQTIYIQTNVPNQAYQVS